MIFSLVISASIVFGLGYWYGYWIQELKVIEYEYNNNSKIYEFMKKKMT
jgi:hypothetical protein